MNSPKSSSPTSTSSLMDTSQSRTGFWMTEPTSINPSFDAIEVVDLSDFDAPRPSSTMEEAAGRSGVPLSKAEVARAAALLESLPHAETMRCHIPPYGLRFLRGGHPVGAVSICWECNNIFGTFPNGEADRSFDGSSAPARELLALCREVAGR